MPESHSAELIWFSLAQPRVDESRHLAYANSICLCFVLLALIGLKTPILRLETPKRSAEIVPVLFQLPPEQTKLETLLPENAEPGRETFSELPEVVPVVAAEPSQFLFSVPVEGAVILTPAILATPPRKIAESPRSVETPKAVPFDSSRALGGYYPEPEYPRAALRLRREGRVLLYVIVEESGSPRNVEVRDSSGWATLDEHVQDWVKRRWQWPPGQTRYYLVPFRFQIK